MFAGWWAKIIALSQLSLFMTVVESRLSFNIENFI